MKGAFLYVKAGKGHFIPAKALADAMISLGHEAVTDDFFSIIGAEKYGAMSETSWRFMLAHPKIDLIVEHSQDKKSDGNLAEFLANTAHHQETLKRWCDKNHPDFILCTHFLGATILPDMLEKCGISIPVYAYASDLFNSVKPAYNPKLSLYYVPTEIGRRNIIEGGMLKEKTVLCPFPLQQSIAKLRGKGKEEARERLSLADTFTILLNLGGEGIGNIDILKKVAKTHPSWQVIIAGDPDKNLSAKEKSFRKEFPDFRLVTPGFTNEIGWYILASDLQMGKAGANSLMESLALHRPFLLSTVLYGALGTKKFLEGNHVGWVEENEKRQLEILDGVAQGNAPTEEAFNALPVRFSAEEFAKRIICDTEYLRLAKKTKESKQESPKAPL